MSIPKKQNMNEEFLKLGDILKDKCGYNPVYYYPNPGNWGDGLIRYGTHKFFNDIGLKIKELKRPWLFPLNKNGTVIYGGGGGWCDYWNSAKNVVSKFQKKCQVIVLPSTYGLAYSIPNTFFFSRDKFQSQKNMPGSIFCHDMAFYIGKEFSSKNKGDGKGYFFRTDRESANKIDIPESNNDLSLKGRFLTKPHKFFEEINKFKKIYTDRLHVSIAACLLEKEVHLYPGGYFKNFDLCRSSMENCFHNVYFHKNFDL